MTIFNSNTGKVVSDNELARLGLSSTLPALRELGYYSLVYDLPEYDVTTHTIELDGEPQLSEDGTEYVQHYAVIPLSGEAAQAGLEAVRTAKYAEFNALFARLDALKIRPAASIAEASAAGEPIPQGDAYRLSELEAITQENRDLRDLVAIAETVEAVRAVEIWWPE